MALDRDPHTSYNSTGWETFRNVWQDRELRSSLTTIFLVFGAYSGLLNVIPFYLVSLSPDISELSIAATYAGYLAGVLIALGTDRILGTLGGARPTLNLSLTVYGLSFLLLWFSGTHTIALVMLVTSGSFFLMHALLSGLVNQRSTAQSSVLNGLYVSFYYAGGSLGAWAMPQLFRLGGWTLVIATLAMCCAAAFVFSAGLRHANETPHPHG